MTQTFYQQMASVIKTDDPKQIMDFIREDKSRLTSTTSSGTCFQYAAEQGCRNAVACLLELGAEINARSGILEFTALEASANKGHSDVVRYLISKGAVLDLSSPDHNPLFHAIYENHADVVSVLLSSGLDPHVTYRTESGKLRNALSFAKECGKDKIIDLLIAASCRMPVEGVDIPVNEDEVQAELQTMATEIEDDDWDADGIATQGNDEEKIVAYVSQRFGQADELALREVLPVLKDVHIAIHVIRPTKQHPFMTFFTTGMSSRAMNVPAGQEAFRFGQLSMHLPKTWPHPREVATDNTAALWPVQILRQLAYLPHVNNSWYGPFHTAAFEDPPQPFGPNTLQSSALLVADKLLPLQLRSDKSVKFFTVIPIYTEELGIAMKLGMNELLDELQKHGVTPMVEPGRVNVGLK